MSEPITQTPDKLYLGDGVYADIEDGMVKLTTEDGIQATNTIYLEHEIMSALLMWYDRLRQKPDRCADCGCPPHDEICPECGHRHTKDEYAR